MTQERERLVRAVEEAEERLAALYRLCEIEAVAPQDWDEADSAESSAIAALAAYDAAHPEEAK